MTVTVQKLYSAFVAAPLDVIRQPDFEQLNIEIDADAGITTALVEPKSRPFDMTVPNVGIEFAAALSGPEDTALDALIAAHTGLGIVRGVDTHTFSFASAPGINDDENVIGAGGLQKYQVGDLGIITPVTDPVKMFTAAVLTGGAARWDQNKVEVVGGSQGVVSSLSLIATNDAIAVSTNPGPIAYNSSDLTRIRGFFTYSSPTLTCQKACRVLVLPRLDSTVNAGSSRSGIRLDIRKNDVSEGIFDNNSDSSGGNATDTQNNGSAQFEVAPTDEIEIFCNSYVTGLSDVWGGPNRLQLIVLEDLT